MCHSHAHWHPEVSKRQKKDKIPCGTCKGRILAHCLDHHLLTVHLHQQLQGLLQASQAHQEQPWHQNTSYVSNTACRTRQLPFSISAFPESPEHHPVSQSPKLVLGMVQHSSQLHQLPRCVRPYNLATCLQEDYMACTQHDNQCSSGVCSNLSGHCWAFSTGWRFGLSGPSGPLRDRLV